MKKYRINDDEKVLSTLVMQRKKTGLHKALTGVYAIIAVVAFFLTFDYYYATFIGDDIGGVYFWGFRVFDYDYGWELDGNGSNFIIATLITLAVIGIPIAAVALKKYIVNCCELYLTDKQVCGSLRTVFAKKTIQIPIEKVDNILSESKFWDKLWGGETVCIYSASGKVRFNCVQNSEEFIQAVLKQIEEQKTMTSANSNSSNISETDELKKYKDLLDSGVITQDEFDKKKKQLLNL